MPLTSPTGLVWFLPSCDSPPADNDKQARRNLKTLKSFHEHERECYQTWTKHRTINAAQGEVHVGGWLCVYTTYLATHTCCRVRCIITWTSGSAQGSFLLSPQISTWSSRYRLETRGTKARHRQGEFLSQHHRSYSESQRVRACVCAHLCQEEVDCKHVR